MSLFDDERTASRENIGPERRIMDSILYDIFPTFYEFYKNPNREEIPYTNGEVINLFSGDISGIRGGLNQGLSMLESQKKEILDTELLLVKPSIYRGDVLDIETIKDFKVNNVFDLNDKITLLDNLVARGLGSVEVIEMRNWDVRFLELVNEIGKIIREKEKKDV